MKNPNVWGGRSGIAFLKLLDDSVSDTTIRFIVNSAECVVGGHGLETATDAESIVIRVHNPRMFSQVIRLGNLGLGESFMNQDFAVERGTLYDFLRVLLRNRLDKKVKGGAYLGMLAGLIRVLHALRGKKANIAKHYDQRESLFSAFLDPTMAYSCGYVLNENDDLHQLQLNKFDRICRKLRLEPGCRVLDIGCGFGGLLIYAAEKYGVQGVGVTLGEDHWRRGNENIACADLSDRLRIDLVDFSKVHGKFDRIVSVGMFEHVPRREYHDYFDMIANALTSQGIGLVHAIGCSTQKNVHDPFTQKYIFPGSNQPKLSEMADQIERQHMVILDVENIVRHYAYTCKRWLEAFLAKRKDLRAEGYDDRFLRAWEYYLNAGIAAAWAADGAVYQVLFCKDRTAPIPLHRV